MKKIKEKPRYNVWQNTKYVFKNAWVEDKIVLYVILVQIFLTVALSTITLFLPKTVIAQITNNVDIKTLIYTIIVFTIVTSILSATKTYFDRVAWVRRSGMRNIDFNKFFNKIITTDYANIEEQNFIDLKEKAIWQTNNNRSSAEAIYNCYPNLGINILGFVIYSILLVSINPIILAITAFTTIIGYFARQQAFKWQFEHDDEKVVFGNKLNFLCDMGTKNKYSKDIRLFAMVDWINDIQEANLRLAYNFSKKFCTKQFIADFTDCVATFLREGIAYGYLIWQVIEGNITVDMFVLYFSAIGGFSGYIMGILNEFATLTRHSLNYCRLREFLEYPEKFNYENGENINLESNTTLNYKLETKNLSFRYAGNENYTLENINLTINSGEKLAIVGLNGAGKTTLVKLLCGFYDPTEGEILLNGKNIKDFNRREYYKLFTAVFQEFSILPNTIAENVAQAKKDDIDGKKLEKCLELADIDKKIKSLPLKEESLLVKEALEDAIELSGGETQRLMLARALYKNSPILILDEPTAALDPIAEDKLYKRYNELSEGKTSIYISHRLASTRFCDRIILLGEKEIIEEGTHEELLNKKGRYYELFEIQSKYYKEESEAI